MYLAWSRDLGLQARRIVSAIALAVFLVAVIVWLAPSEHEAPDLPSVSSDGIKALAVLPLDNLSADPDQDTQEVQVCSIGGIRRGGKEVCLLRPD